MDPSDISTEDMPMHENLGSPLVIETLSKDFIHLKIPQTLRSSHDKLDHMGFDINYEHCSSQENTEIIIVEKDRPQEVSMESEKHKKSKLKNLKKRKHRSKKPKLSGTGENTKNVNHLIMSPSQESEEVNLSDASTVMNDSTSVKIDSSIPRFYSIVNKVVSIMDKHCQFCFTGKLKLKVIHGSIKVYGALITDIHPPVDVYSPHTDSHVVIENSNETVECIMSNIHASLLAEGIESNIPSSLKDDIKNLQQGSAIIVLTNLENNLTQFLSKYYADNLFPKLQDNNYHCWTNLKRAQLILQSNLHIKYRNCNRSLIPPSSIDNLTEEILQLWSSNKRSCTLMVGGTNVGKSTTCRYLINNLLHTTKRVILVDLDIGQTECGPAGCISYYLIEDPLLGPNFTHIKSPVHQLYVGDVDVTKCFMRYMKSVKLLMKTLYECQESQTIPIIINTMGYLSGIGLNIIHFISKITQPTILLQITSNKAKNNLSTFLTPEVINNMKWNISFWKQYIERDLKPCQHKLHIMHSQNQFRNFPNEGEWRLKPREKRDLMMMSYLSRMVEPYYDYPFDDPTAVCSINQVTPYVAPFTKMFVLFTSPSVPAKHILSVMNGNIVALCGVNVNSSTQDNSFDSYPRVLPKTSLCTCYGFGIIRGVDMEQKQIYINTPLSITEMKSVNCLAGSIPLPQPLLEWNKGRAPYMGGNNNLPTSKATHRGYFRISNN